MTWICSCLFNNSKKTTVSNFPESIDTRRVEHRCRSPGAYAKKTRRIYKHLCLDINQCVLTVIHSFILSFNTINNTHNTHTYTNNTGIDHYTNNNNNDTHLTYAYLWGTSCNTPVPFDDTSDRIFYLKRLLLLQAVVIW